MEEMMKEFNANLGVMDHLDDCIRMAKGDFDKHECLQTICDALTVIMKNQGEILSKIVEGSDGMDHLSNCIGKVKAIFDRNECLQAISEELMVILKNQNEFLSKIEMGGDLKK
jgi:hypothetical protein